MDGRDALGAVRGTVEIGHAHAAKTNGADLRSVRAQFSPLHPSSPYLARRGTARRKTRAFVLSALLKSRSLRRILRQRAFEATRLSRALLGDEAYGRIANDQFLS